MDVRAACSSLATGSAICSKAKPDATSVIQREKGFSRKY